MKHKPSSYRWIIAILSFIIFFVIIGLGVMPRTLYIVPVTNHFNFSRGEFSIVFSVITFTGLVFQLFYGYLVKKIGLKVIISLGLPIIAVGYLIFSKATTLSLFYLGAVLIGIGFNCSSLTSISILIKNWFREEQQGTMLGFIAAGSGLGGSLFCLIIGQHIVTHGFSASYLLTAIILALTAIPVIIFVRSEPNDENENSTSKVQDANSPLESSSQNETLAGFFKQTHAVLALVTVLLIGIAVASLIQNLPPYFDEKGFDSVFVAQIISALLFVQAVSKIILGLINDRFGIKTCLNIGLGSFVISTILLILANSSWMIWIYVVIGGISRSTIAVLVPLFARAILGKENYERFIGVFMATLSGGVASESQSSISHMTSWAHTQLSFQFSQQLVWGS